MGGWAVALMIITLAHSAINKPTPPPSGGKPQRREKVANISFKTLEDIVNCADEIRAEIEPVKVFTISFSEIGGLIDDLNSKANRIKELTSVLERQRNAFRSEGFI